MVLIINTFGFIVANPIRSASVVFFWVIDFDGSLVSYSETKSFQNLSEVFNLQLKVFHVSTCLIYNRPTKLIVRTLLKRVSVRLSYHLTLKTLLCSPTTMRRKSDRKTGFGTFFEHNITEQLERKPTSCKDTHNPYGTAVAVLARKCFPIWLVDARSKKDNANSYKARYIFWKLQSKTEQFGLSK